MENLEYLYMPKSTIESYRKNFEEVLLSILKNPMFTDEEIAKDIANMIMESWTQFAKKIKNHELFID